MTLAISLREKLTLSAMEEILSDSYRASRDQKEVHFDLRQLRWTGYFPATLLLSWFAELRSKQAQVSVSLPKRELLPAQPTKVLLELGILSAAESLGVELPYASSPPRSDSLPLVRLDAERERLWSVLHAQHEAFETQVADKSCSSGLQDAFGVILFELVENAMLHAEGKFPHYGLSLATSAGTAASDAVGLMDVFPPGTQYAEIVCGDLGPGIPSTLSKTVPTRYEPRYGVSRAFTKEERTMLYAFEFSSTSNPEARRRRLAECLTETGQDPRDIASGLFCVLDIARARRGQFVVRTPTSVVSFSYVKNAFIPRVAGRRELHAPALARLPGTHYVLRIPMSAPARARSVSMNVPTAMSKRAPGVEVVAPFDDSGQETSVTTALATAIARVDEALQASRDTHGISVVTGPNAALPPRALALFLVALRSMHHGSRQLVWDHGTAFELTLETTGVRGPNQRRAAVLVGEVLANRFRIAGKVDDLDTECAAWLGDGATTAGENLSFPEPIYAELLRAYGAALKGRLAQALAAPSVRRTQGPFLIENQYYTDVFFEVARAFDTPERVASFSRWIQSELRSAPDLILVGASTVRPIAEAVARAITSVGSSGPTLVDCHGDTSWAEAALRALEHKSKSAIVVTDVVCRGQQLAARLSKFPRVTIRRVFSFVDARTDASASLPFRWTAGGRPQEADLVSVLAEPIRPMSARPRTARDRHQRDDVDAEHVYIIDAHTHAPTLYARRERAPLGVVDLLRGPAREASALYRGHYAYHGKHYLYFLHFPRLFASLRARIERWVRDQVAHIRAEHATSATDWHAVVFDPDGSIQWLPALLQQLPERIKSQVISEEQLRAPPTPTDVGGTCLLLLPAAASGETARRSLEYVSRMQPKRILMLCIASRLDPYHAEFLTGITRYRDAEFHVAFFLEFPPSAFGPGPDSCPGCRVESALRRYLRLAEEWLPPDSRLLAAFRTRTAAAAVSPLDPTTEGDRAGFAGDAEYTEAMLSALYTLSERDLAARRELSGCLKTAEGVDAFLAMLAFEKSGGAVPSDLARILYDGEHALYDRAREHVFRASPPDHVGRLLPSIIDLVRNEFTNGAVGLIERYAQHAVDVDDICVALVTSQLEPAGLSDGVMRAGARGEHELEAILAETQTLIQRDRDRHENVSKGAASAAMQLWSHIARSSPLASAIDRLTAALGGTNPLATEVSEFADELWREYQRDVPRLVGTLRASALWSRIGRPDSMDAHFAQLARDLEKLRRGARSVSSGELFAAGALDSIRRVRRAFDEVGAALYRLFTNPLECRTLDELADEMIGVDGGVIAVTAEYDRNAPLVFFDPKDLSYVCNEIVGNWSKHHHGQSRVCAGVTLTRERDCVRLEFWDEIAGDFEAYSAGGLRHMREIASLYDARVSVIARNGVRKVLRLDLRFAN